VHSQGKTGHISEMVRDTAMIIDHLEEAYALSDKIKIMDLE